MQCMRTPPLAGWGAMKARRPMSIGAWNRHRSGWWSRLAKLSQGRFFGHVLAATCERLQEVANRVGVRRLVNLGRCPAR